MYLCNLSRPFFLLEQKLTQFRKNDGAESLRQFVEFLMCKSQTFKDSYHVSGYNFQITVSRNIIAFFSWIYLHMIYIYIYNIYNI